MPSRAYNSFLRTRRRSEEELQQLCQCPLGLITHFYNIKAHDIAMSEGCQCPLGLITHFYPENKFLWGISRTYVSMPSRAYNSFLHFGPCIEFGVTYQCQCPLGLITHFYQGGSGNPERTAMCQCPLGLITHFYATPPKTQVLCGFQNLFLQVFVRIFWQQPFFVHVNNLDIFSRCSAFKYVFLVYHRKCKLSSYFFTLYYKNRTFHYYLLLSIASYIYKRFFAITDMLP